MEHGYRCVVSTFAQPPRPLNHDGEPRKVGVELELSGLELSRLSALVKDVLGGEEVLRTTYETEVRNSVLGTVKLEFDATMFREMKVRDFFAAGAGCSA